MSPWRKSNISLVIFSWLVTNTYISTFLFEHSSRILLSLCKARSTELISGEWMLDLYGRFSVLLWIRVQVLWLIIGLWAIWGRAGSRVVGGCWASTIVFEEGHVVITWSGLYIVWLAVRIGLTGRELEVRFLLTWVLLWPLERKSLHLFV